mmetsp:Transcript_258/g.701  ORF Transcript_258/g.701 Transcript_258/m.701 type:complete len:124 (-) Transcript_258:816-1187(-)
MISPASTELCPAEEATAGATPLLGMGSERPVEGSLVDVGAATLAGGLLTGLCEAAATGVATPTPSAGGLLATATPPDAEEVEPEAAAARACRIFCIMANRFAAVLCPPPGITSVLFWGCCGAG